MNEGLSVLGLGPYLSILIAATLPTQIWRWLGVAMAGRLSDDSELFVFVKAIATALVAAVIAKLLLFSAGPLGALPLWVRLAGAAVGVAGYVIGGRRLIAGIVAAEVMLATAWFSLAPLTATG